MNICVEKNRRGYPVSLLCAAEAVFGPDARLTQLTERKSAEGSQPEHEIGNLHRYHPAH